jgi:hypothetical protein
MNNLFLDVPPGRLQFLRRAALNMAALSLWHGDYYSIPLPDRLLNDLVSALEDGLRHVLACHVA